MVDLLGNFDDLVFVNVGGSSFCAWTDVEVVREIDSASGSFTVGLTETANLAGSLIPDIIAAAEPDSPCTVTVNGQLAITGFIDTRKADKDAETHRIVVSGRSSGRQCVDCSHIDPDGNAQYNDQKPSDIAKKVAGNLGVGVVNRINKEKPIEWFRYNLGDTALNVIHSAALKQGINVGHDAQGNIVLADNFPDQAPAALVLGQNIKAYSVTKSATDRMSDYEGKGQKAPNANVRGKQCCQMKATAQDGGLKTYRPKYVVGMGDVDSDELKERVAHEAARRSGLSLEVQCTVVGWTANGGLWEPGQRCFVSISDEGIQEELLIKTVHFSKDEHDQGTLTEISLSRPEAYEKGQGGGQGQPGSSQLSTSITSKAA